MMARDRRAPADSRAGRRDPGARGSSSSPRARDRQDVGARRALRPRVDAGHRRRARSSSSPTPSAPRPSCARGSARASPSSAAPSSTRELDGAWISTIHGFCMRLLRAVPVRGRARPALPRARREPGGGAPRSRRSTRRWPSSARRRRRAARASSRRTASRGAPADARPASYETLRAAGRPLELQLGDAPSLELRVEELRAALATGIRARRACSTARPGASSRSSTSPASRSRATTTTSRRATAVEQAALNELAGARPRAARGAAPGVRALATRRRRTASRRSTSRISSSARATCSRRRRDPRARAAALPRRSASTSSRTRTASSAR